MLSCLCSFTVDYHKYKFQFLLEMHPHNVSFIGLTSYFGYQHFSLNVRDLKMLVQLTQISRYLLLLQNQFFYFI